MNKQELKELAKRFRKAEIKKYEWSIKYIKSELKTGRHIIACLGSAGFTFLDDINRLVEYARSIGDSNFADLITKK